MKSGKPKYEFEENMPRCDSSGWILRFEDRESGVKVDILVNKNSEVFNSQLILNYCLLDERLLPILHYLKAWNAKLRKRHHPKHILNNYSLYLMVIAFLQEEKILPNLQLLAKDYPRIILQPHQVKLRLSREDPGESMNFIDASNVKFSPK